MRLSNAHGRRPIATTMAGGRTANPMRRAARLGQSWPRVGEPMAMAARPAIMVVDDESAICDLLVEGLGEEGYAVHVAPGAAAALELLARTPDIGLMVTDVVMPGGLNGFDLARRAQAAHPALKVIYISAYSMAEAVAEARPEDEPMVRKPFRFEQMLDHVRRTLGAPA